MPITHQYVSSAPPVPGKVDSTEWNRDHVVIIVNADVDPAAAIAESKLALNYPTTPGIGVTDGDKGDVTISIAGTVWNINNASVIVKLLTDFSASAGTVSATDSILSAFQKIVGNIALKLTANDPIVGATKTKITYDANGLIIAGEDSTEYDIPALGQHIKEIQSARAKMASLKVFKRINFS